MGGVEVMFYVEIKNNKISCKGQGEFKTEEQIEVSEEIYNALTNLPSDYVEVGGEIISVTPIPLVEAMLTQAEKREQEYQTNPLIEWQGENITVDQANIMFMRYFAEADERAKEIQTFLIGAKNTIREMHPDEV